MNFLEKVRLKKMALGLGLPQELPEDKPDPFHLLQMEFYWSVLNCLYIFVISMKSFKVFHHEL